MPQGVCAPLGFPILYHRGLVRKWKVIILTQGLCFASEAPILTFGQGDIFGQHVFAVFIIHRPVREMVIFGLTKVARLFAEPVMTD